MGDLERQLEDASKRHQEECNALEQRFEDMEERHRKELADLDRRHRQQLRDQDSRHEKEMKDLEAQVARERRQLQRDRDQARRELQEEISKDVRDNMEVSGIFILSPTIFLVNSLRPDIAYILIWSSLVQMAWHLCAKPLPQLIMTYCRFGTLGINLGGILSNYNIFINESKKEMRMSSANWQPLTQASVC